MGVYRLPFSRTQKQAGYPELRSNRATQPDTLEARIKLLKENVLKKLQGDLFGKIRFRLVNSVRLELFLVLGLTSFSQFWFYRRERLEI